MFDRMSSIFIANIIVIYPQMVILLLVQLCVIYRHVGGSAADQGGENQQSKLCRLSTEGLTTCSTFDR